MLVVDAKQHKFDGSKGIWEKGGGEGVKGSRGRPSQRIGLDLGRGSADGITQGKRDLGRRKELQAKRLYGGWGWKKKIYEEEEVRGTEKCCYHKMEFCKIRIYPKEVNEFNNICWHLCFLHFHSTPKFLMDAESSSLLNPISSSMRIKMPINALSISDVSSPSLDCSFPNNIIIPSF
jgi:hypothetical protein